MQNHPHAVIVDLLLENGSGNGIEYIKKVYESTLNVKPYIIVTTNLSSKTNFNAMVSMGVDFIYSKHQKDYVDTDPLDLIRIMSDTIMDRFNTDRRSILKKSEIANDNDLTNIVTEKVCDIGINPKHKGFDYLIRAICYYYKDHKCDFLDMVASDFKKKRHNINKSMQDAIDYAFLKGNIENQKQFWGDLTVNERGSVTVKDFVCYVGNKV